MVRRTVACCLVVVSAVVLWGFGGSARGSGGSGPGSVVDVYSDLPLRGPSRSFGVSIANGIKLALAQAGGRAGQFTVRLISLDSTPRAGQSNPDRQVVVHAGAAAGDPLAVYYIGDAFSSASEVSIPVLNRAGVAQVSPSSSYVGLTMKVAGVSAPGEPGKFYPTGRRTFLRIAAADTVEAAALLTTLGSDRCRRVALASDKEAYGAGLVSMVMRRAGRYGVRIVSHIAIDPAARNFRSYAGKLKRARADCFVFSGFVSGGAVRLTKAVAAALPAARLYGSDQTCTGAFTNPRHGIPGSARRRFKCTSLTLPIKAYPGGRAFLAAYKAKYGVSNPDPYAIYGYESMRLGLDTIAKLGARGDDRSAIVSALFGTKNRHSVLGTYSFDRHGDTTLRTFGLYKVSKRDGVPVFIKNIKPR
jgi:branched-chain amino acid transport system substrate-binding protein